jgi:starvation-inducible DNA-binding protein
MASRPATTHEKHHKINIGLTDEQRQGSIEIVNRALADEHVIYIKTRNYHWNVIGPQFVAIHELLEQQYHAGGGN